MLGIIVMRMLRNSKERIMAKYEITAEMNLKTIIDESKEVAQALLDFADRLTEIDKKYSEVEKKTGENTDGSNNGDQKDQV